MSRRTAFGVGEEAVKLYLPQDDDEVVLPWAVLPLTCNTVPARRGAPPPRFAARPAPSLALESSARAADCPFFAVQRARASSAVQWQEPGGPASSTPGLQGGDRRGRLRYRSPSSRPGRLRPR